MNFARFINHVVVEVVEAVSSEEFAKLFHAQVVGMFTEVPNEVQIGWINHTTGVISPATMADYFIDTDGNKHVADTGGNQVLQCAYENQLIFDNNAWRVETDADRLVAIAEQRVKDVKLEVGRRIYAIASQAAQTNIAAAVGVISGKTASARSNDEKAILADAETALGWVAAMRGNVAVLAVDPALDMSDDANWPVTPPEVIALAAQF